MEKNKEDKKDLLRFICVFFTSKSENTINKNHKKVIVIEVENENKVENELINNHGATYIKSFRDLNKELYYHYNNKVAEIASRNDFNLKGKEYEKKKAV